MNPEYIERLNITLGDSLEHSANEITIWYKKLNEAYELKSKYRKRYNGNRDLCACFVHNYFNYILF